MTKVFAVMGYNNTRLADVKKLETYARELHGAELVLCKDGITATDRETVRHCLDNDLAATEENIDSIIAHLGSHALELVGVLPFSDHGVPAGALLASRLGLPGADPAAAACAADKHLYRAREARHDTLPGHHRTIRAREIHTADDAVAFWHEVAPRRIFLKPKGEGNSRGCTRVEDEAHIGSAFAGLSPYLAGGVMAEECVDGAREYSVDHVAGFSWLTEKTTTTGAYRAEIEQVVPAPLAPPTAGAVRRSGYAAAEICGYAGSAFHNEVFLLAGDRGTAVVEPNLRPAGMRIWDLAALAFDFDPWTAWLDHSRSGTALPAPPRQRGYAGIRMLRPRADGFLASLPQVADVHERFPGLHEVVFTKAVGDPVSTRVENNADFVGHVICAAPTHQETRALLLACTRAIEESTEVTA
ncbi:hypothetical protein [Streptomyces sp. NBC_00083]|uniref:ATP-grasp domain-containing protein n=1 Tax=Streptomyces sp. NBC_00083 TaxID=2975647 RepID=UPI002259F598|nr:hypothetical protein [Streptomyces sp. NBC_00083]MCX5388140.1 hypothetical protein [Streptomyces sp. NBC_00083]